MRRLLVLLCVLVVACGEEVEPFTPASYIDKLRILGVRAEPADIAPGQSTRLDALVADPLAGTRDLSYVWIICEPRTDGSSSPCQQESSIRDPQSVLKGPMEGLRVIPFLPSVTYDAPDDVLDTLPEGSPARMRGLSVAVLLVVFEGMDLQALMERRVEMQVALKQIRIAPSDASLNSNPRFGSVLLDGSELQPNVTPDVASGSTLRLSAMATPESVETFTRVLSDGTSSQQTETMAFSWFTTQGTYRTTLNANARTGSGDPIQLELPAARETATVYVVLRDARGGIDWVTRTLNVR